MVTGAFACSADVTILATDAARAGVLTTTSSESWAKSPPLSCTVSRTRYVPGVVKTWVVLVSLEVAVADP